MQISYLSSIIKIQTSCSSAVIVTLCVLVFLFSSLFPISVIAKPWISSDDIFLRSDIQLLSDIGVIKSPVTTWPLNWSGIKRDLFDARARKLSKYESEVRQRVLRRCKFETRKGSRKSYALSFSAGEKLTSSFGDINRENIQLIGSTDWLGKRFALNLHAATVVDPDDDKHLRYDGSYAAVVLDNWILSAGLEERWWGPGWSDSLLVGRNARPVPAVSIRRNYSSGFDHKLLSWIGLWHFDGFIARLETKRAVENALMFGGRFSFKPATQLEISLSRLSMFGGKGNSSDASAFFSAVRGDDEVDGESDEILSLSGIDFRYAITPDFALYSQFVLTNGSKGEGDLGMLGVDFSLPTISPGLRGYVEVIDTDIGGNGINNYASDKYATGLYYKERSIGNALFGRSAVVGGVCPFKNNGLINFAIQFAELMRDDASAQPKENMEIGMLSIGYATNILKGQLKTSVQIYSKAISFDNYDSERYGLSMNWQKGI